jgi:hypothetical protein
LSLDALEGGGKFSVSFSNRLAMEVDAANEGDESNPQEVTIDAVPPRTDLRLTPLSSFDNGVVAESALAYEGNNKIWNKNNITTEIFCSIKRLLSRVISRACETICIR